MSNRFQDFLMNLESVLNSNVDFVQKVHYLSEELKRYIGADRCTVYIHDCKSESFWSAYIDGISFLEIPDSVGIAGHVFKTGKSEIINDVASHPMFFDKIDTKTGYETKTMMTTPILDKRQNRVGVIQILNKIDEPFKFSIEDEELLQSVMKHFSEFISYMRHDCQ